MRKFLFFCFFTTGFFLFGQTVNLDINKQKEQSHGLSFKIGTSKSVKSIFTDSMIVDLSQDVNNPRNFGKYIETMTEITYMFKGKEQKDVIYVVYSNLLSIEQAVNTKVTFDTILGYSNGTGTPVYPDSSDLYIYIYTKEFSPFLAGKTKQGYIEEDGIFWWNPLFLFEN